MCYSFCGKKSKKSKKFSKFWKKWKKGIEFATQKEKKRELDECEKEKMQNKKSQRNDVLFLWNLWKKNQREEKGLFETSCKNKSTLNTTNVKRSQGAQDRFSDDLGCDSSKGHHWERSKWCNHKPKEILSAPIKSKDQSKRFVLSGEQREANLKESKDGIKTGDGDSQRHHRGQAFSSQMSVGLGHSCKWQRLRSQETKRDIEELQTERQERWSSDDKLLLWEDFQSDISNTNSQQMTNKDQDNSQTEQQVQKDVRMEESRSIAWGTHGHTWKVSRPQENTRNSEEHMGRQ